MPRGKFDLAKRLTREQVRNLKERIEKEREFLQRYKTYVKSGSPILVDDKNHVIALRPGIELIDYKTRQKEKLWVAVEGIKKTILEGSKHPFIDSAVPPSDRRHLKAILTRKEYSEIDAREFRDQVFAILEDSFSIFYEIGDHEHYLNLNGSVSKKDTFYRLRLLRKEVYLFLDSLSGAQKYTFPKNKFFASNSKAKGDDIVRILEKGANGAIRNWRDWLRWKKIVLAKEK